MTQFTIKVNDLNDINKVKNEQSKKKMNLQM